LRLDALRQNQERTQVPDNSTPFHAIWDRFVDALDRAGQAGSAADVEVPAFGAEVPAGKRFGELTRADVDNLSRMATKLGRRTDVVKVMWDDMLRKQKRTKQAADKAKKAAAKC
jgi:hypothetical protein